MKAHSELFALSETAAQEIRKQRLRSNEMIQVNSFWKAALRIMDRALIESDMHMASEIFCPWSSWQWEESGKKTTAGHSVVDTDNKLLLANYRAAEAEMSRAGSLKPRVFHCNLGSWTYEYAILFFCLMNDQHALTQKQLLTF